MKSLISVNPFMPQNPGILFRSNFKFFMILASRLADINLHILVG